MGHVCTGEGVHRGSRNTWVSAETHQGVARAWTTVGVNVGCNEGTGGDLLMISSGNTHALLLDIMMLCKLNGWR